MDSRTQVTLDINKILQQLGIDPDKFKSLLLPESDLQENTTQVSVQPVQKQ
jgi:hypothetical protein